MVVQTAEGYRVIALDAVQEVTFLEQPQDDDSAREEQNVLSLQLQWKDGQISTHGARGHGLPAERHPLDSQLQDSTWTARDAHT